MSPTLVVLAAGVGSRYGGLKQLAPVGPGGELLLEYSVHDALAAGFDRVVLVVRPQTEASFRERFAGGMDQRVEIAYAHQRLGELPAGRPAPSGRSKPWGTAHAVLAAREHVNGAFAVINADDLYGAESFSVLGRFLAGARRAERASAMVGFPVAATLSSAGPVSRAVCEVDGRGRLRGIVELPSVWRDAESVWFERPDGARERLAGDTLVSMNMWGFRHELFAELERRFEHFLESAGSAEDREFLLPEVIQALIREGDQRVEVLRGAGEWSGVTFRDDLDGVSETLRLRIERGEYPGELW